MKNIYCNLNDLSNKASVETFFSLRLLEDLGYKDRQIRPKTSLEKLAVNLGSKQVHYKPDFALVVGRKVRWLIEAKAPSENIEDHIPQCAGYALSLVPRQR